MSGYHPALVVGETPKQYRIEAIERMRRRRRDRYLLSKKAESVLMLFEQTRGTTLGLT